ncbi:hypothetical protein ABZX39_15230 [Streptomyces collinus]|uniref:hypothetical protein n=1 Tax=Streptomyces collinus TaxID=42684 RepID=UPI0033B06790
MIGSDGTTDVYNQSSPATGDGTITKVMDDLKTSVTTSLAAADDVWMVNSAVQWLTNGKVQQSTISNLPPGIGSITPPGIRLETPTTVATGVDATQAWAPGPNALSTQSVTSDPDTTGQVRSYTTGPLTAADDDVRSGIVGDIMADDGPCLTDPDPEMVPYFGSAPADDTDVPIAQQPSEDPSPTTPSNTVSGKFTLGNGNPVQGLTVTVTAADATLDSDSSAGVDEPVLGTATTAADGTWKLDLPAKLPASVQQATDDNGGALNLNATTAATTTTGVPVLGIDALTAVPVPSQGASLTAGTALDSKAAEATDGDHTVPLVPDTVDDAAKDPSAEQEQQSLAAKAEAEPQAASDETPLWQSDHSVLPADYNPYAVGGKDISAEAVTPQAGDCQTVTYKQWSKIRYTVVGEAHANWDAKASFQYDSSMNSSVELAINSNGNWKAGASRNLSNEFGLSTGYTNKGSYYAHQYKVPIEYRKYKKQYICTMGVKSTWYTVEPKRYKLPAGQAVGKIGKDVSAKDGSRNYSHAPNRNKGTIQRGTFFELTRKKSTKFGHAVSIVGIGLSATTSYDNSHKQKITAGNRKSAKHLIWGKNGRIDENPGVFYSN